MYFEDLYSEVLPLWKDKFSLKGVEVTMTYIDDVKKDYVKIDNIIERDDSYSEWHSILAFAMYQAITYYGISEWRVEKNKGFIYLNEISLPYFELFFLRNLEPIDDEDEGNVEYLNMYAGFKSYIP